MNVLVEQELGRSGVVARGVKSERDRLPLSCSQNKARSLKPTVTKTKRWNHELLGNVVAVATEYRVTGAVMEGVQQTDEEACS